MSEDFSNIEAVILDKDGVFNDFHKVWLRIIAYRAQLIAELSAETSESLVAIRTACIRAMGVDEEDETIDPYGPCSLPLVNVRLVLATALYITMIEPEPTYQWSTAFEMIDRAIEITNEELSVAELAETFPGALEKIKDLSKSGLKLAVFTSDSDENTKICLEKFKIADLFKASQAAEIKTARLYKELCNQLGVKPENTLMVTDSPHDLRIAKEAGAMTALVLTGIVRPAQNISHMEDLFDVVYDSLADLDLGVTINA
ncbi:MAG: HAD-IA family hydrolase [Cyanobacteria bacterium]|nr:HAD-IA family hydrolase [Cyanobacteriota bacterium]MDA1021490.1 HAD-IA family hydrolase [Cyanobacteriota bacterium]